MDTNPYAPPAADIRVGRVGSSAGAPPERGPPPGTPLHVFTLKQMSRPKGKPWSLSVFDDALYFTSEEVPSRTLDRMQFFADVRLLLLGAGALSFQRPKPRVVLALHPEALAALRVWLTPDVPLHLARALANGRWSAAFLGVVWLIPTRQGLRPMSIAFGLLWLAWALAVTLRPHRALFLVQAFLWGQAGLTCFLLGMKGSPAWYAMVGLLALAISADVKNFMFFGKPSR